jgi:hypothetical protein
MTMSGRRPCWSKGKHRRTSRIGAVRLIAISRVMAAASTSSASIFTCSMTPALFTSTSNRPYRRVTNSASASTSEIEATSQRLASPPHSDGSP